MLGEDADAVMGGGGGHPCPQEVCKLDAPLPIGLTFSGAREWQGLCGLENVGAINQLVVSGKAKDLVQVVPISARFAPRARTRLVRWPAGLFCRAVLLWLSVRGSVCPSICPSVCLSVGLPDHPSFRVFVC